MIAKFDDVKGENLATLLTFIHSDENCVKLDWTTPVDNIIVWIKSVTPKEIWPGFNSYNITLEIRGSISKAPTGGQVRVDPKYLLRVYQIIGQELPVEKRHPLSAGTKVRTTSANSEVRYEWLFEVRQRSQWGVEGVVITHHDSHGLCYEVQHEDGTQGCYDPSELEVVS